MQKKYKVLIVDRIHDVLIEKLKTAGIDLDYIPDILPEKILNIINTYHGLVIRSKMKIDKPVIDRADNLVFIARAGSGMENIDVDYAEKRNIICLNSPEGNSNSVGEHALGMLLSLLHKISTSNISVKNYNWDRLSFRGEELAGKTVGIIGFGNTGSAFARKLSGMDVMILTYDKYKKNFSNEYVKECSLSEIQKQADIISFHVPYNKETHYYLDKNFIDKTEKAFYLINTSRGKVINTKDMLEAVKSGKIIGACLDVIEFEDTNFNKTQIPVNNKIITEILQCENILLTPHIAGLSRQSDYKIASVLADKIIMKIKFL
ncbi:MAG: 2-hydroxyacid dehydrogenase [Marinilabiliales bacterium]